MYNKIKDIYRIIIFAAIMLAIVLNLSSILSGIKTFISMINSIIIGAILAFILNVPMKRIEDLLDKLGLKKFKRTLAILSTLILVILILVTCMLVIIPNLTKTFSGLVEVATKFYLQVESILRDSEFLNQDIANTIIRQMQTFISMDKIVDILMNITLNASAIFSNFFSIFLGIFFMINFLVSKEHLMSMCIKLMKVFLSDKIIEKICYVGRVSVETYDKFLLSKIIEAFIIGIMIAVSYTVLGLPYGVMVGVLAGVLSFIPYVGSMSAMLIGALFIFVDSPIKAVFSIVVFNIIQFIEDNIVYPRVVGQSVGLPAIFTLAAAGIGGGLFGILGMVFFTPIFAVIYRLVKEFVYSRLDSKDNY